MANLSKTYCKLLFINIQLLKPDYLYSISSFFCSLNSNLKNKEEVQNAIKIQVILLIP